MKKTNYVYPEEIYNQAIEIKQSTLERVVNDLESVEVGDIIALTKMILGYEEGVRTVIYLSKFNQNVNHWEFEVCSTRAIMDALDNPTSQARRQGYFRLDVTRDRVLENGAISVKDHRVYKVMGKTDEEIGEIVGHLEG